MHKWGRNVVLWLFVAFSCVGCFDYEAHVRIAPDGEFVGHLALTGPEWLLERWDLAGDGRDGSVAMANQNGMRNKMAGRGTYVSGHDIREWNNRFVKMRYAMDGSQWSFAAAVSLPEGELRHIREEMEKRSFGRGLPKGKMDSMTQSLYRGSNLDFDVEFPFDITDTNADKQVRKKLFWTVPLADLEKGPQFLFATGTIPSGTGLLQSLSYWLPGNEPD